MIAFDRAGNFNTTTVEANMGGCGACSSTGGAESVVYLALLFALRAIWRPRA